LEASLKALAEAKSSINEVNSGEDFCEIHHNADQSTSLEGSSNDTEV
jgi:hypothetical protein